MFGGLADVVWPRICEMCGRQSDRPGRHVCSECLMRIPFLPTQGCCRVCGRSAAASAVEFVCDNCQGARAPAFDRAASAVRFEGAAREALLRFKFRRRLYLRDDFVDWMEAALNARFDVSAVDAVLPMPSTFLRRLARGYDQCEILASDLAKRIGRSCLARAIGRRGMPKRQAELSAEERFENAKGTFRVRDASAVRGRTLLLVDDIMTTGATLSECARTLKAAGAWRVWCVTAARSMRE